MLTPVEVRLLRFIESYHQRSVAYKSLRYNKFLKAFELFVVFNWRQANPIDPQQSLTIPSDADQITGIGIEVLVFDARKILK